jgi:hypothetical protein
MVASAILPIPTPKILSKVTVPTGGWTMAYSYKNGAGYVDATFSVPAGSYYVSGDGSSSDFIYAFANAFQTAANAAISANADIWCWINTSNKVVIGFTGTHWRTAVADNHNVKLRWTTSDSPSVGKVLGFDVSAVDENTTVDNPTFTADYQHAYGWYASDDGCLAADLVEDVEESTVFQSRGPSGVTRTQYAASAFRNMLNLQFVARDRMFSREALYTETPGYPYEINQGLECWWLQAKQGTEFRVYRHSRYDRLIDGGTLTSAGANTSTDSVKSWTVNQWAGYCIYIAAYTRATDVSALAMSYIESNTATVITHQTPYLGSFQTNGYRILPFRYQTYVLDLSGNGARFEPEEIDVIDRYNFKAKLLRYES